MTLFSPEIVLQKVQSGFEFRQAELSRLKLDTHNIDRANFIECYMRGAVFTNTSCQETNFKKTNLAFAKFKNVNLTQAILERVELNSSVLNDVILNDANGYKAK